MSEGGSEGESVEAMERQHKLKYFQLIFTDTQVYRAQYQLVSKKIFLKSNNNTAVLRSLPGKFTPFQSIPMSDFLLLIFCDMKHFWAIKSEDLK